MSIEIMEKMSATKYGGELAEYIHDITQSYEPLGDKSGDKAVAFDLDKTIIYSETSLSIPADFNAPLRMVEFYERTPLTFMTEASYTMLGIMAQHAYVIPVTARRQDQMERVMLPWGPSKHYVCLSGAVVAIDGKEDKGWSRTIQKKVADTSIPLPEIQKVVDAVKHEPWVLRRNVFGDMFEVITLDLPNVPESFFEYLSEKVPGTGFLWSVQGRKLYLTPEELSKGDAFQYLVERLGIEGNTYGAGDSLMDVDLLKKVDYPFHPLHGEISEQGVAPRNSIQSAQGGVLGGEEIVARVFASVVR